MSATSTSLVSQSPRILTTSSPYTPAPSPATPNAKPVEKAAEAKPSPGSFRHPKLTEIIRRQERTSFTQRNFQSAGINAIALILTTWFRNSIHHYTTTLLTLASIPSASEITSTITILFRILFFANVFLSLRPILPYVSKPDAIADIPLTPSQRKLLGLPPSAISAATSGTASSGYITPPRYTRRTSSSSTSPSSQLAPSTDRRSISANYSSSPLSTSRYTLGFSPSPAASLSRTRTASGSPFSPIASPLLHKAVHNRDRSQDLGLDVSSRTSLGVTGSPLGRSIGVGRSHSVKERPSRSPAGEREEEKRSPIRQKGVNYKWLYDKGFGVSGRSSGGLPKSEGMPF